MTKLVVAGQERGTQSEAAAAEDGRPGGQGLPVAAEQELFVAAVPELEQEPAGWLAEAEGGAG